jgi:hypothetical protein
VRIVGAVHEAAAGQLGLLGEIAEALDARGVSFWLRGGCGALVCRGFESWPFPDGALDGPLCRIGAVSCRTLAPHALLYEKETYELHRGRPPRPKDHESIRLLRELAQAQPKRPVT